MLLALMQPDTAAVEIAMTIDEIRSWKNAEPFHPFVIHTKDRGDFLVDHPMCVAISPLGTDVTVALPDSSSEQIYVSSIARLEAAESAPSGRE